MDKVYPLIEMGATYIENLIILMAVITISGQKFKGMRYALFLAFFSLISSVIVIGMNEISVFSFLTPILTIAFVIFVTSKIASTGSLIVRITACMLAFLVVQTIDYILVVLVGFVYGVPHDMFTEFTTVGPKRSLYLLIDKLTDVLLYLFIRKHIKGLKVLSIKLQMVLCSLSIVAYTVMQLLFGMVIKPDLMTMQIAVIFSWLFVLCLIAVVFSLFSVMTKAEKDKQMQEILQSENALMARNYQLIHADKVESAKRQHDFNHHLKVMRELVREQKIGEMSAYLQSLLDVPVREGAACHSGNDIIDAIINCKAAEADRDHIEFEFNADFHLPTSLSSIDICGVLSNQIDNALEACRVIPEGRLRKVIVEIRQKECFAFFTVKNTAAENPLLKNPELASTKMNSDHLHGWGIKNIRDTVERNNGFLLHEFENGYFVSSASLCFRLLDT